MAYLGLYQAGDFFRHPATGDRDYALQNFPDRLGLLARNVGGGGTCCIFGDGNLDYANEEGKIVSDYNNNFRLDLQGKAREFDITRVTWTNEPPAEFKTSHIAQFQVQFGYQSQVRLTKSKQSKLDYLTKNAGALAGVMLGMRQVVTAAEFRQALQMSFNRIATVGGEWYGVVMSNVTHPDDDRFWPQLYYWCPECIHLVLVKFRSRTLHSQQTLSFTNSNVAADIINCRTCGNRLFTAQNKKKLQEEIATFAESERNTGIKLRLNNLRDSLDVANPAVPLTRTYKHDPG